MFHITLIYEKWDTVEPPNTLGTGKKMAVLETGVKGVIIYLTQKNTFGTWKSAAVFGGGGHWAGVIEPLKLSNSDYGETFSGFRINQFWVGTFVLYSGILQVKSRKTLR